MVRQISNNQTSDAKRNITKKEPVYERLHFHDVVLFLIPILFLFGFFTAILTSINTQNAFSISATISAIIIGYCLFIDSKNLF